MRLAHRVIDERPLQRAGPAEHLFLRAGVQRNDAIARPSQIHVILAEPTGTARHRRAAAPT
jgi:hypothetical protein